jgi:hypothetical protein
LGYSHYFTTKRSFTNNEWKKIMEKSKEILNNSFIGNAFGENNSKPIIEEDYIGFNGIGEMGYETCSLEKEPEEHWNACKTGNRSYDWFVVAFLKMVRQIAPDAIELRSDGGKEVFA